MAHDLIDSTEMYLRTVLELEEEAIPAIRARLAERLGLSAPAISEGVSRLQEQGLLVLNSDRTVTLTGDGRALAEDVMRKHRLAERLLVDVLGLEHEYVHEEACRWEHVISDRVAERLVEFLGHPTTSPYGNPIPGAGSAPDGIVSLAEARVGTTAVLHSISERLQADAEVMHVLHEHGMVAGESVEVLADRDGVVLELGGHRLELSPESARLVYVVPAPA